MNEPARTLVRLSAALARRDQNRIENALREAAGLVGAREIEEVVLQSYLFLGYPAALQALSLWRERSPTVAAADTADDPAAWLARGERVCEQVYGGQYGRLRENVARLHPDLERWMVMEGYGKVLGRPGLDLRIRELCIIALLVAQDAPQQLYAHLRGALNVGSTPEDVESALEIAADGVPASRREAVERAWREVLARRHRAGAVMSKEGD